MLAMTSALVVDLWTLLVPWTCSAGMLLLMLIVVYRLPMVLEFVCCVSYLHMICYDILSS
jgi:hypothetical protein